MTAFLASVRSEIEAGLALDGGADIIDLKEPASGALGRLPEPVIRAVLASIAGRRPVSATTGDLPSEPARVLGAVRAMAATGVDIVKVGLFEGDIPGTIAALARGATAAIRLVAVMFADRHPDIDLVDRCADAGFFGVMLDTADKAAGPLTRHLDMPALDAFVTRARTRALAAGLAGSLRVSDISDLARLQPDYLGFRSALASGRRDGALDEAAIRKVRATLDQVHAASLATAAAGAASAAASASAGGASTKRAKLT